VADCDPIGQIEGLHIGREHLKPRPDDLAVDRQAGPPKPQSAGEIGKCRQGPRLEDRVTTKTYRRPIVADRIDPARTVAEILDQLSNQTQEFLLLWSVTRHDEKGSDLNVRDQST
jgi:hypothetical protein